MIKKFFFSKLFVLFACMLILGFIIGYDYSVITSGEYDSASIYDPPQITGQSSDAMSEAEEHEDLPVEDNQAGEKYIELQNIGSEE